MITTVLSYSEPIKFDILVVSRQSFLHSRKTVLTFALMSKTIIAITALLLLFSSNISAENNAVPTKNEKSAPDKVSLSSADTKRKEQVAQYICYPLSHIKINSPYGYRKDPFTGKRKFHNGIDLHARHSNVYAMLKGKIIKVGQDKTSGKYIVLQHGNITVSYCHLSHIFVSQDQLVKAGQAVAITGNTGRSTSEHLHISCKFKGESVNPTVIIDYISLQNKAQPIVATS